MKTISTEPFKRNRKHLVLRHFLHSFKQGVSGTYFGKRALFYDWESKKLKSTQVQGPEYERSLTKFELIGVYDAPTIIKHRNNFYADIDETIKGEPPCQTY